MDSGRLFFDASCHGNMLLLENPDSVFQGPGSLLNMEETTKKRPFFSSPEELMDEEYYDEQLPEKKRRLTPEQVKGIGLGMGGTVYGGKTVFRRGGGSASMVALLIRRSTVFMAIEGEMA